MTPTIDSILGAVALLGLFAFICIVHAISKHYMEKGWKELRKQMEEGLELRRNFIKERGIRKGDAIKVGDTYFGFNCDPDGTYTPVVDVTLLIPADEAKEFFEQGTIRPELVEELEEPKKD